jgi:hypothetical protein
MGRLTERIIDLIALAMLLFFAYVMRENAPELAGGIAVAACAFWLTKNASAPNVTAEQAAALAAAEVLKVARATAATVDTPDQVEIVGAVDVVTPPRRTP